MTLSEEGRPHFLNLDGDPVFAVLHEPSGDALSSAVLLVAPFGWEESSSYRGRRAWATALAREGYAVLRFDLPGTGDSAGSPNDTDRVGAWLRAITSATAELRVVTGCSRVTVIGLGLGGLLACAASAAGADIDDLVLWAVPSSGRAIMRELRAFAKLEASLQTVRPHVAEPTLSVNGFVMSDETAAAISALDVNALPPVGVRRVLLLDKDGLPGNDALRDTLVAGGAAIETASGFGYGAFMAEPQRSMLPWDVMATVSRWLAAGLEPPTRKRPRRALHTATSITAGGVTVRERLLTIEGPDGSAFGVLTEPQLSSAPLCAVLLNAGGVRRIGPSRMWVEAARRWASLGVPTLRVDLAGIGDAGGPDRFPLEDAQLYEPRCGEQVRSVLDALGAAGLPPRFLLVGLCSGAYWSFQVAQLDDRVVGLVMLNPAALVYDPFQWTVRRSRFVGRLLKPGTLSRVLRGKVPIADALLVVRAIARRAVMAPSRLPGRLAARRTAARSGGDELDKELDRLRELGPRALLVLSAEEPLREELARDGRFDRLDRWPNLRVELLDGHPAAHMLQPRSLQEQANQLMDSALGSLLSSLEAEGSFLNATSAGSAVANPSA